MALGFGAAAVNAGLVAVVCGLIAFGAWRAMLRTGNRDIWFVVAAFALLSVKSVAKALELAQGPPDVALAEFAFSLADLVAVGLIAWPLVLRRGA